jgi:hypothetical protein
LAVRAYMGRVVGRAPARVSTVSHKERTGLTWPVGRVAVDRREVRTAAAAGGIVAVTALALWLAGGVRIDEIARYVGYELGFVIVPGWLVYRALVVRPPGLLAEVVFSWSLGYLLEILAFIVTAASGGRSAFDVYPVVVGVPALLVIRRRRVAAEAGRLPAVLPVRVIWIAAGLCTLLLLYTGAIGFTQSPLPRGVSGVTYQEDTVFAISLAAEALHHWPITLPMVSGLPLHYHLFAYMHMAAIAQVTGIDLSVVVMRLYEIPLLVLLVLQLILAGRAIGRRWATGLAAVVVVLFLGELDMAAGTGNSRFLFRGLFFYWLLASHTFLFGLVFFVPATVLLAGLLSSARGLRARWAEWVLFGAFLVACVGTKAYSLVVVAGALVLVLLWQLWRARSLNRPALVALAMSAVVYIAANIIFLRWNSAGAFIRPLRNLKTMPGVEDLNAYFGHLWGTTTVPGVLAAAFGTFGLLGVVLVGIALLLRQRRLALSTGEVLLLSLFVVVLPTLFVSSQPGFGQMFFVFFGLLPGAIAAAQGYLLWLERDARPSLRRAAFVGAGVAVAVLVLDAVVGVSGRVGLEVTLFWIVVAIVAGLATAAFSRGRAFRVAVAVGAIGLLALDTPAIRLLRGAFGAANVYSVSGAAEVIGLGLGAAALVVAVVLVTRRRQAAVSGVATAVVASVLLLGVIDTPLDWFPKLIGDTASGKTVYRQDYMGLTSGLYRGLHWVRQHTSPNAVLVVNNHSLYPDGRDSKYFYYSAFAERRVVLESWDYTEQTTSRGYFSLPVWASPFPTRLKLSQAVFHRADRIALHTLAHDYRARYLLVDKVHGQATPLLDDRVGKIYGSGDLDVYEIGKRGLRSTACVSEQGAGIAALFGTRRTFTAATKLWHSVTAVGYRDAVIQQRGCRRFAVVLTDLASYRQGKQLRREAAKVNLPVRIECRSTAPRGGLNAVFGHRRTMRAAQVLATKAQAAGFLGLDVQQDRCGDWEVDLAGLKTAAQRQGFRREARHAGFNVRFERG